MSIIDSTFVNLGEHGMEDENYGEYEPPEMKYDPVKIEVPDDTGNVTEEESINDSFIKDDENGEKVAHGDSFNISQRRTSARVSRTLRNVRLKEDESFDELEDGANDKEWSPDEDDWEPKRKKRKTKSTAVKKGGAKGATKRKGSEEQKEKAKVRVPKTRTKTKTSQVRTENSGNPDVKLEVEDFEEESGSRSISAENGSKRRYSEKAKVAMAAKRQNMTPEEREAQKVKDRERARIKREQLRNTDDPTARKKLEELRTRAREQARLRRALLKETKSEKLEEQRAKAREKMRLKRTRLREAASEDAERKLEEMREKSRERMRQIRELAKQGALPEDRLRSIEIQKEKDRERKRAKRAAMSHLEKKAEFQKNYAYRISKLARLDEDAKREIKIKEYMQKQAKLAEETPEERQQRLEKLRERGRLYYHRKKDTMDREKMRERQRQWWHGMDPERKNKYKERYREMYKKRMEALKEDPEKWAEIRKQWTERDKSYRQQRKEMIYVRKRRKEDNPDEETTSKLSVSTGKGRKWADYTDEQKEKCRERRRERQLKKQLAIQQLLKTMTMEQIKQQTETPEQRERRCIQMRIRKARRALRIRLEHLGATPEEIQQREEELKRTYQPKRQFRPYKPRPDNWKPIDPNEVSKLEAEGKLDDLTKIEPFTLLPKPRVKKMPAAPSSTQNSDVAATGSSQKGLRRKSKGSKSPQQQLVKIEPPECVLSQPTTIIPNHHQQSSVLPNQPLPQLNYSQSQCQEGHSSLSYHSLLVTQPDVFQHPHQQVSQQPCSLQNILDGLTYVQTGTCFNQNPSSNPQQVAHSQYDTSATSSQYEYASSYHDTDNYDSQYSPPTATASLAGGGKQESFDDHSNFINTATTTEQPAKAAHSASIISLKPTIASTEKEKKAKPKKKKQRPYRYHPSKNPNAKLRGSRVLNPEKRTFLCDQCTQSFSLASSLDAHRKHLHNPAYDVENRICRICHEPFKHAQVWFSHYYNVHVKPNNVKPKPFVCDLCGSGFMSMNYLIKHQYYQHGDGLKKENHQKCPVCEKLFKATTNFNDHMLKYHPDHDFGTHECYRCDKNYSSAGKLRGHVKEAHPESYFPCPDCHAVRFTELGLFGHFRHGRCSTVNTEKKRKLKESFSMDKLILSCELCSKKMVLGSLGVHYRTMHGAQEELFKCSVCQTKQFKNREFWAIHLEEKHQIRMEEIIDTVRMLNMVHRDGVSMKPLSRRKPRRKKMNIGAVQRTRRKISSPKRPNKSDNDKDASETEDEDDWTCDEVVKMAKSMIEKSLKKVKRRRNIIVIAEEDEMETLPHLKIKVQ